MEDTLIKYVQITPRIIALCHFRQKTVKVNVEDVILFGLNLTCVSYLQAFFCGYNLFFSSVFDISRDVMLL